MIQTQTDKEREIKAELEVISQELKKLQAKIDRTQPKTWLLKELCKAKDALLAQKNAKVNLLNTMPRW